MAGLAPSPLHVEAEPARLVAPEFGIIGGTEQGPDQVEGAGVGGRVGPGRPANGALVDVDHLVDVLDSVDPVMGQWPFPGSHELFGQSLVQNIVDQGAFAAATDPGDHRQVPRGMDTSMSFRLLARAPLMVSCFPFPFRRSWGTGIFFRPLRYWPVMDSGTWLISSAVPGPPHSRRFPRLPVRCR